MVDAATIEKLEAGFSKLQASDSKSLLKKYLTKEVFDALKNKKTSFGSTLLDCIQSGSYDKFISNVRISYFCEISILLCNHTAKDTFIF